MISRDGTFLQRSDEAGMAFFRIVHGRAWFSPGWYELFGFDANTEFNTLASFLERIHEDDIELVRRSLYAKGVSGFETDVFRMKDANDNWRHVHSRSRVVRDSNNDSIWVGSHTDITDLYHQLTFLKAIVDLLPEPVFVKDEDRRFTYVNDALSELFGRPKDSFIGSVDEGLHPDQSQADRFKADDLEVLSGKKCGMLIEDFSTADGIETILLTKKVPFQTHNGERYIFGVSVDVAKSLEGFSQNVAELFAQARLEVVVTSKLTQSEIAAYFFHMADLTNERFTSVVLDEYRQIGPCTHLRFKGDSYETLYSALPDLLAPFQQAKAIEWERVAEQFANDDDGFLLSVFKRYALNKKTRWRFAERMANVFSGYRNARVYEIRDGKQRGIRLDIFTNKKMSEQLSRQGPNVGLDRRPVLFITATNDSKVELIGGDLQMGDKYEAGQAGAIGPNSQAHDMTFQQIWNQTRDGSDLDSLASDLASLRSAMRSESETAEHDVALGEVAKAESAASSGDGPTTLKHLRNAGQWALDVATKIGIATAVNAIKQAMTH